MKLNIIDIQGQGDASKEYVSFIADADCDLKNYVVSDSTYTAANSLSNTFRHTYWWSPQPIRKGDVVLLYTRKGVNSSNKMPSGNMAYVFYWGSDHAIWNNSGDTAVLFELSTWQIKKAK